MYSQARVLSRRLCLPTAHPWGVVEATILFVAFLSWHLDTRQVQFAAVYRIPYTLRNCLALSLLMAYGP